LLIHSLFSNTTEHICFSPIKSLWSQEWVKYTNKETRVSNVTLHPVPYFRFWQTSLDQLNPTEAHPVNSLSYALAVNLDSVSRRGSSTVFPRDFSDASWIRGKPIAQLLCLPCDLQAGVMPLSFNFTRHAGILIPVLETFEFFDDLHKDLVQNLAHDYSFPQGPSSSFSFSLPTLT
jgi:hypothetical protein